jgi:hypothetical protein
MPDVPDGPIADLTVHPPDDGGMRRVSFVLMGNVANVPGVDPIMEGDDALGTLLDQLDERYPAYRIRVTVLHRPGEADRPRRSFPPG